ncbi:unnamed protein product [Closterium sp. Naga37s-1]|nr:unnamed protein product [Closterium sp. Naga37s-1]
MRSRRGSRRDANKGGVVPIRALDAAQPFDYEHRQKRQLEEKGRLNIGILGFGNFGQFLARRFARHGHRLTAWSRSDYSQVAKQMGVRFFTGMDDFCEEHPDVVLLCTSIISSDGLLRSLPLQRLKRNTLFVDVLSVKVFPKMLLLQVLPPEFDILCTHPMFGPESGKGSWEGLSFVFDRVRITPGERAEKADRFLQIFHGEGCRMVEMTCEEHDKYAAGTQFVTHTVGRVLGKLGLESTPINTKGYETLLNLVENTAGDSFDLYYGLFMYNTNATEQLQRVEMAFDAVKKQLLDQLHDVLRLQLFGMPPSATALPSSSPPSSSSHSSHSSHSSRASSPSSSLTSSVPRSPTAEQGLPTLPRRPSFPPPSAAVTRGAADRGNSGNSSGSSSSGSESEGEEWRPKGAAHRQVFVDQEVSAAGGTDGASAAVYSFGDSTDGGGTSAGEEESGGNGEGKERPNLWLHHGLELLLEGPHAWATASPHLPLIPCLSIHGRPSLPSPRQERPNPWLQHGLELLLEGPHAWAVPSLPALAPHTASTPPIPTPQERPNPWLHHGLELLLEGTKGGLKRLSLQFEWQVRAGAGASLGRCELGQVRAWAGASLGRCELGQVRAGAGASWGGWVWEVEGGIREGGQARCGGLACHSIPCSPHQVPFTDRLLGTVGRLCPTLEEFTLVAADYLVTETAVAAFLRACTQVHTFHCYVRSAIPIHSLGDNLLWQVNRKWPHLQSLAINGNHITENGVFALASCAHLHSLSLHGYHRGIFERAKTTADGDAVLFSALSSLSFSYNLPSPAELRRILRMCPLLSSLVLHPSPPPPEATPGSPSSRLVSGSRGMHEAVTLRGVVEQECKGAVSVFIEEAPAKKTSYDLTAVAHGLGGSRI